MKRLFTFFSGLLLITHASAQTVWSTGSYTFTKTAPFQQDCITPGVCLTRGSQSVLYNEVTENYLDGDGNCDWTPGNTTWAYGNISDWATLTYQNLYDLNGCTPPSMVNQPMVLHIMPDDIYLQLTFSLWAGSSSGNFTYTRTTQIPLGIKLNSFEVKQNNGNCMLDWVTASEKDNKGFYVERSHDGRNFETLGFVSATANAAAVSAYTYTDAKPYYGFNYYRLKQVDYDGQYDYSWIVNTSVTNESIKVYPNPATNVIRLESAGSGSGSWKLSNAVGTSVKTGTLSGKEINISELPPGMYILTIMEGQSVTVRNIVKL